MRIQKFDNRERKPLKQLQEEGLVSKLAKDWKNVIIGPWKFLYLTGRIDKNGSLEWKAEYVSNRRCKDNLIPIVLLNSSPYHSVFIQHEDFVPQRERSRPHIFSYVNKPTSDTPGKREIREKLLKFKEFLAEHGGYAFSLVGCPKGAEDHIKQLKSRGFSEDRMVFVERDYQTYKALKRYILKFHPTIQVEYGDFFSVIRLYKESGKFIAYSDFDSCYAYLDYELDVPMQWLYDNCRYTEVTFGARSQIYKKMAIKRNEKPNVDRSSWNAELGRSIKQDSYDFSHNVLIRHFQSMGIEDVKFIGSYSGRGTEKGRGGARMFTLFIKNLRVLP